MKRACLGLFAVVVVVAPVVARAEDPPEAQAAYADMKQAFGMVPSFFRAFPSDAIAGAWEDMKGVQLNPKSAIPGKYKELIGLAVASQIPCRYCIYFHTRAAGLMGASDREVKEAVVLAGLVRKWSTVLNGNAVDEARFRAEVRTAFANAGKKHGAAPAAIVDADSAYADIKATLGTVPSFFKLYPRSGIAGAWREFKQVQGNPSTAIPGKYKELTGLAISAQIPCRYCVFYHTEAAKLMGATDDEIHEAIAVASIVRHWSTFLNGAQIDEVAFRKDVDDVVAFVKGAHAER